jgi:hypothetical protein
MVKLTDAEFAAEYLNAASEDDDPKTYLTALKSRFQVTTSVQPLVSVNSVQAPQCASQRGFLHSIE